MDEKNAHDVKYLTTYGIKDAHGIIKEINQQIDDDLMIVPPNSLSSPSERVHPLRWASIREFLVVETHVPRATKETIAATISELNTCPYCEDAHKTALSALGDKAKKKIKQELSSNGVITPATHTPKSFRIPHFPPSKPQK